MEKNTIEYHKNLLHLLLYLSDKNNYQKFNKAIQGNSKLLAGRIRPVFKDYSTLKTSSLAINSDDSWSLDGLRFGKKRIFCSYKNDMSILKDIGALPQSLNLSFGDLSINSDSIHNFIDTFDTDFTKERFSNVVFGYNNISVTLDGVKILIFRIDPI